MTLALLAASAPAIARGESLSDEERRLIEERVENLIAASPKITIKPGNTVFMVKKKTVKAATLRKPALEHEALVTGVSAPKGVVVHPRLDELRFEENGAQTDIVARYVIHVEPNAKASKGKVSFKIKVIERSGLGNTVATIDIAHTITIGPAAKPTPKQLAADFYGYRYYRALAEARAEVLGRAGFKLSIQDLAPPPSLDQLKEKGVAEVLQFLEERTRMWIAHRHLVAAARQKETKKIAEGFLANLTKKPSEMTGLPDVRLTDAPRGEAPPPPPPPEAAPPPGEAKVETLEPTAVEPAPGSEGEGKDESSLKPVTSYEPGSEADDEGTDLPESSTPREEVAEAPPATPIKPGDQQKTTDEQPDQTLQLSDDPFAERQLRKITYIHGFNRGLVLDDPNIAHGAAFRFAYASVTLQESAVATAFFFEGQVALTRQLGAELTVPVEFVDVNLEGARRVFQMGNPLVAAKYRIFLPEVVGRRPALTLRARWALPISPLHNIPPTGFGAETFTREAHFADTYAFFLEKTAIGLGFNLAWQWEWIYAGLQFYSDYFFPISGAADRSKFFTLNYGFSLGVLPFGEIVGAYVEARAASLLYGPQRTEFFMYFGVRAKLLSYFEPGVWVGVPLGSVLDVSGPQFGGELRFSYDLADILDPGTSTREDRSLIK
jgi:hypothetical protein